MARERRSRSTIEYPIYLTTGRVVSQYLSGTQTRRIGALVDQYPEPSVEIHPRLAQQYGIADGDWVTVTTRRNEHHASGNGREDHPAGYGLHPLSLGRQAQRQPADSSHARSAQQDPRVQSIRLPHREGNGRGLSEPDDRAAERSTLSSRRAR